MTNQPEADSSVFVPAPGEAKPKEVAHPAHRAYILLLILFCLFFNGGLLAVSAVTYQTAFDREATLLQEDGMAVFLILGGEYLASPYDHPGDVTQEALLSLLSAKSLVFTDGERWITKLPREESDWTPPVFEGTNTVTRQVIDGEPYLCYAFRASVRFTSPAVSGAVDETQSKPYYLLKSIAAQEKQYRLLTAATALASLLLSLLYAAVSWRMLRRLSVSAEEKDLEDAAPHTADEPSPARQASPAPSVDLGLLCRDVMERFAEEAEERGILLTGSARPSCLVAGDAEGLTRLTEELIRLCFSMLDGGRRLSLLVTRRDEGIVLTLTAEAPSLPEDALADSRLLAHSLGGEFVVKDSTVSVTWPPVSL